mmetsp:Transcript_50244/g.89689  ORF Transcript_50244/g.89689 Transcript_50244/m.89689 type:complete len:93 (+) Transcript_50244:39-317(+)
MTLAHAYPQVLYEPPAVRSLASTLISIAAPHTVVFLGCCFYSEDHVNLAKQLLHSLRSRFSCEDVTTCSEDHKALAVHCLVIYRLDPLAQHF